MDFLLIIFIFIGAAAAVVLVAKNISRHKFKCRHCSKQFSISWSRIITAEHSGKEYKLICPFCNTKDWCTLQEKNT